MPKGALAGIRKRRYLRSDTTKRKPPPALYRTKLSSHLCERFIARGSNRRTLARLTGLPINQTNAFRERSVGVMEGLTFEEAASAHAEQYAALLRRDFEHVILGGESYRQCLTAPRRNSMKRLSGTEAGASPFFPTPEPFAFSRFI
jgi:bisphosphoglycerate-dependent phosphoglycerate mutase